MKKVCFKCNQEKPIDEFYKHPAMGDGHLGKCKECAKKDAAENYTNNREHYSQYEKERNQRLDRKTKKHEYARKRNAEQSEKHAARKAVSNAVRDGRLKKQPCEVCQNPKAQAHHEDYSKPLDVNWLCFRHHRERHGQTVVSNYE